MTAEPCHELRQKINRTIMEEPANMKNDGPEAALVGLWKLEEAFLVDAEDRKIGPAFGKRPVGYINYLPSGMMMTVVTDADRPPLSADRLAAPVEERAAAFSGVSAYAGTWAFDGRKVTHRIELSSLPNWVGTEVVRFVEIAGDRVIYRTAPQMLNGVSSVVRLVWAKQP
jgi:hypothetical protein